MVTLMIRAAGSPCRRGSMYIAVLLIATIVSVIGISALTVTRLQLRSAEGASDVTAACLYAQSAIEMGLFTVNDDADWRSVYSNDDWLPERSIGDGVYTLKLVDEVNGSLTADPNAAVRLYGWGMAGDAVRIYSVLLEVRGVPNLLRNPGIESGTTYWVDMGDCDLEADEGEFHGGAACLHVQNRDDEWAGPRQDIADQLTEGVMYETEVWVRMKDFSETAWLGIWYRTEYGWVSDYFSSGTVGTGWTLLSGQFTAGWSGTLSQAYWKVDTQWSSQEFMIDDAVLHAAGDGSAGIVPVAGTWRRVMDEDGGLGPEPDAIPLPGD
jgi:hypothetical protein